MKLWIDDYRPMPEGFDCHAHNAAEAILAFASGEVTHASFDYHLGGDDHYDSGWGIAAFVARQAYANNIPRFTWKIHSDSAEGALAIRQVMEQAEKHWLENEMAGSANNSAPKTAKPQ
jgi:hypothetical protein